MLLAQLPGRGLPTRGHGCAERAGLLPGQRAWACGSWPRGLWVVTLMAQAPAGLRCLAGAQVAAARCLPFEPGLCSLGRKEWVLWGE